MGTNWYFLCINTDYDYFEMYTQVMHKLIRKPHYKTAYYEPTEFFVTKEYL